MRTMTAPATGPRRQAPGPAAEPATEGPQRHAPPRPEEAVAADEETATDASEPRTLPERRAVEALLRALRVYKAALKDTPPQSFWLRQHTRAVSIDSCPTTMRASWLEPCPANHLCLRNPPSLKSRHACAALVRCPHATSRADQAPAATSRRCAGLQ
eukprot:5478187-Amphidinium_carterae.1